MANMWLNAFSKLKGRTDPFTAAERAGFNQAYQRIGQAWGNELAGTPGVLARSSMGSSPGALARMRARTMRHGVGQLALAQGDVAAEGAQARRNWWMETQRLKMQKEAQGGGGLGGALGKIAGGAIGGVLSGGNPLAAVQGFLGASKKRGPTSQGYDPNTGAGYSHYTPTPRVWTPGG